VAQLVSDWETSQWGSWKSEQNRYEFMVTLLVKMDWRRRVWLVGEIVFFWAISK
jgi:hypothetical protein